MRNRLPGFACVLIGNRRHCAGQATSRHDFDGSPVRRLCRYGSGQEKRREKNRQE